jgi:hypothetical protein
MLRPTQEERANLIPNLLELKSFGQFACLDFSPLQ